MPARDELDAFDNLDATPEGGKAQWETIDAEHSQPPRRGRRALIALLLLALVALMAWRWGPWAKEDATPTPAPPATAAPASPSQVPEASATTALPSRGDPSRIDGFESQAVEGREAPTSGAVSIPAPTAPKVKGDDPESAMRALVTVLNARQSGDGAELAGVQEQMQSYAPLGDVSALDPYQEGGPMQGRAPATVTDVKFERVPDAQPADSKVSQTRKATVRVQSHTGEVVVESWRLAASLDGDTWKVAEATLESWTGEAKP